MKILRLELRAFGPFTDVALDLSAGCQGLHLIYGANEAGKSSALRALRQLFYGIPAHSRDAFVHPYAELRVGATLRHSDGNELPFFRRKGNRNTLRGSDDVAVLESGQLERFLGGLEQGLFMTLFGINHATLVQGGQEIATGGGHFGEVLFAASAGIAGLRDIQKDLQKDAEALFLPRGSNPRINKTLRELRDAQAELQNHQLSSDEWVRHDRALQTAVEHRQRLDEDWHRTSREQSRLTRIRDALPLIADRKQLLVELDTYHDAVLLPDNFPDQRGQAETARQLAKHRAGLAELALEKIEQSLDRLEVPNALLAQAEAIERLKERLGEHRKAMEDRPRLVAWLQEHEHEARNILQALGRPRDLHQAETLRLRADEPIAIQKLANQHQGLLAHRENARQTIDQLQVRLRTTRQALEATVVPPDVTDLRREIRQTQQRGDLEQELATARAALERAERQVAVELARLPYWSGTLDDLENLALPAPATLDRFERSLRDYEQRLHVLDERRDAEEKASRELERQMQQLQLERGVPTEEDLRAGRRRRDAGWQLVRRTWLEHQEDREAVAAFIADLAPGRDLAEGYEHSVQLSDELADRLRREADRVARQAELIAQCDQRREQAGQLAQRRAAEARQLAQEQQQWAEVLRPLGLSALTPPELRAWLRQHGELVRQAEDLRTQREHVEELRQAVADLRARLKTCLNSLGQSMPQDPQTLAALLERAQGMVDRCEEQQRRHDLLREEAARLEAQQDAAVRGARVAQEVLDQWQVQWTAQMSRLGLEPHASPDQANVFLAEIHKLFGNLEKAKGFRSRLEGIDRDAQHFAAAVQALVRVIASDLADKPPERALEDVYARLGQACAARQEQQTLLTRREQENGSLQRARQSLAEADIRLDALCRKARCDSADGLPLAEQRSARRAELERNLRQCEKQICIHSAGVAVEAFIAEAAQVDADALGPILQGLADRLAELRAQIQIVDQTIGSERTELARMNGSAAAAAAAEKAESLLAQLQVDVPDYTALRLATVVLQRSIERFRAKNQGPVLDRAGQLFAALTAGSFAGLRIDSDEEGETVLLGVRPGGRETIGVEGMSDGCCDQLYLALRLASLEAWLETHESIPFIVDDILLNCDNERAVAALHALAELSRRTQVIFFTHHAHLVELAEQHLDEGTRFVHRLPERRSRLVSANVI
jgi:uncharacterized protein YhaN